MESAALEAYRKDIENNADMSSRAINETLEKSNLALSAIICSPPSCGYLSLAEQEAQAFISGKQQLQVVDKFRKRHNRLRLQEDNQQAEEERTTAVRETMKARRVVEEQEEVPVLGAIIEQPTGPYAGWRTVEPKPHRRKLYLTEEYLFSYRL